MPAQRFMWLVAIPLFAIVAVVALVVSRGSAPADTEDTEAATPWTFMVYMMGDTNLEPYALDDLTEMASVGSNEDLNVVAMVDRSPDYTADGVLNLDDWEDTKLLEVGEDELLELDDLGELDTGDPDTLASFVETAITQYPAQNYALLLWDHGGGWIGMGADETNGEDGLALDEIAQGIDAGLAATDVDRLDMIGFDACLMATYEVASTLAPYADYMVASEEVEPGHGWNYGRLSVVEDDPAIEAPELATAMLDGYVTEAEEEGTESDITLGLLDLGAVDELQAAMADLSQEFIDEPGAYTPGLASAQRDVLEFGRDPDPAYSTYQIDLGGFLANLAEGEGELAAHAVTALDALDAVVLDHVAGPATSESTGLSIYFPPLKTYFEDEYLGLADVPTWPATLSEFFTSGALLDEASRAVFDDDSVLESSFGEDGLDIFVPLEDGTADSVVEATLAIGFEYDGDSVYVMEMPAALGQDDAGRTGISADYDLTYMTISDGEDDHLVYQSIGIDPGTGNTVIDIPLDYVAPGDDPADYVDALLSIVIDDDGNVLEEDLYARDAGSTLGAFDPDPDGLLFPVALVSTADGEWTYERTDGPGIWADLEALEYAYETVPSGTVLDLNVSVRDYAGTGDHATFAIDVP